MELEERAEVFINVHKGLRRGLAGLALDLGQVDWEDDSEVKTLDKKFSDMLHFLREHAANEDEVQFPMLEARVPDAAAREREEHREQETELDGMERDWNGILRDGARRAAGYRFYLGYNRFLSGYLTHMDREETHLTDLFYRHFSDAEIEGEFKKIVARTSPEDMGMMLSHMLPAMNPWERRQFLAKVRASAPPEVFGKVKGLAQKVLAPRDWDKLSAHLA
jgi:hemerythrin-like domain-containing protein